MGPMPSSSREGRDVRNCAMAQDTGSQVGLGGPQASTPSPAVHTELTSLTTPWAGLALWGSDWGQAKRGYLGTMWPPPQGRTAQALPTVTGLCWTPRIWSL